MGLQGDRFHDRGAAVMTEALRLSGVTRGDGLLAGLGDVEALWRAGQTLCQA